MECVGKQQVNDIEADDFLIFRLYERVALFIRDAFQIVFFYDNIAVGIHGRFRLVVFSERNHFFIFHGVYAVKRFPVFARLFHGDHSVHAGFDLFVLRRDRFRSVRLQYAVFPLDVFDQQVARSGW